MDFKNVGSDGSASIEFGGIDHSKYTGQLARVPLNTTGNHWAIDNVDFSIGNVSMNTHEQVILGAYRSIDRISSTQLTVFALDRLRRRIQHLRPGIGR